MLKVDEKFGIIEVNGTRGENWLSELRLARERMGLKRPKVRKKGKATRKGKKGLVGKLSQAQLELFGL